jgi:hypothetical protein
MGAEYFPANQRSRVREASTNRRLPFLAAWANEQASPSNNQKMAASRDLRFSV